MRNRTLSTSAVARLLNVAVSSVANWIDRNQLKAGRTPGGHRRVRVADLLAFLQQQGLPVPTELQAPTPTILVVDDEAAVADLIVTELKATHPQCQVLAAYDGFAAGEQVVMHRPDVVILDLRMPGLDGYEVCRRIKARAETHHAAVIAVTAHCSPQAAQDILACGAQACLAKPLDFAVLRAQVSGALAQRTGSPATSAPTRPPGETAA